MDRIIRIKSPTDDEEYKLFDMKEEIPHWFLQNKSGEGMGFGEDDMFELLDKFFKEKY